MPTIAEVRQKFPQYEDMSDDALASALHKKFYSDMPETEFRQKIGLAAPEAAAAPAPKLKGDASRYSAASEAVQGATLGAAIPVSAALMTPLEMIKQGTLNPVDAYRSARDQMDADRAAYLEANPRKGLASNIVGGLAGGGTLAKGGATLAGKFGPGPAARVGEVAAEGALYGGVTGLNEARGDVGDQLAGAATGAAIGGVAGGTLAGAGQAIKGISSGVRSAASGMVNPEGYAARKVTQRLAADGMTLDDAATALKRAPGSNLADVAGENTRDLVRTASNIPGRGRQAVQDMVDERLSAQRDALMGGVSKKLAPGEMYNATLDDIVDTYRKGADPLYQKAYAKPVSYDDFKLDELMPRIPKQAWAEAQRLMSIEGYAPKQLIANIADDGAVTFQKVPDMRQWDYLKRGMDSLITAEDGKGAIGGTTPVGRALNNLKNEVVDILDKQNPAYKAARQFSSDQIGLKKALESGTKLLNQPLDDAVKAIKKMPKAEQEVAKVGLARSLRDKILAGGDNSDRVKAVWNEKTRRLLESVFDKKDFRAFAKFMEQQKDQMKTVNTARYNSTTARQLAGQEEAGNDAAGMVGSLAMGRWEAALNAIGRYARKMGGLNEKSAGAMTDILLSDKKGLASVEKALRKSERKTLRGAELSRALGPVPARATGLLGGYTVSTTREGR
jgi:hypothetical protein